MKVKPFLKPDKSTDDKRFNWLDQFLAYLRLWKVSIDDRPGDFSQAALCNMFLSWRTYEGIPISILSLKEVKPYLLRNGFSYVLSGKFCQDDLENYFGFQGPIGCRKSNPAVYDTVYNDNTIKTQYSVEPSTGNVRDEKNEWNVINTEPLSKRHKKEKMHLGR